MDAADREVRVKSYSIRELVEHAENTTFVIPPFQRDVVWDPDKIISLWDSMYRFYPIGSLLYWKTPTELEPIRAVGGAPLSPERLAERRDAHRYILDGQQRLTAIYVAMKGGVGLIEGQFDFDYTLYFDATADLAGVGQNDAHAGDTLDIEADIFNESENKPAKSHYFLFARDLRARREKLEKAGLPRDLIVRVSDASATSLERMLALKSHPNVTSAAIGRLDQLSRLASSYQIPVTRVSGVDLDGVCGIYMRINRFGRKLDPADIVIATMFGSGAKGFNLRKLFSEIRDKLGQSNPRWRQVKSYTLFQMIGSCMRESRLRDGKADFNRFGIDTRHILNLTPEAVEPYWDDIQSAITRTLMFMITEGFYQPDGVPATYMLMPLCAHLFQHEPGAVELNLIKQWLWRTAFDSDSMATPQGINRARAKFFLPLSEGRTPIFEPLTIEKRKLLSEQNITSAFSQAMLAFLSRRGPVDFKTGAYITINPQAPDSLTLNDPTIHHVCPKKLLGARRGGARSQQRKRQQENLEEPSPNALLNLSLLPGVTNHEIGHKSPAVYFPQYAEDRKRAGYQDFPDILDSHLIPPEFAVRGRFIPDVYPAFLEARWVLFTEAMGKLLPDVEIRFE